LNFDEEKDLEMDTEDKDLNKDSEQL